MEFNSKETKHLSSVVKNIASKFYWNLKLYYVSNAINKEDLIQELELYSWQLMKQFEEKGRSKEDYMKAIYKALRNKAINLLRSSVIFRNHLLAYKNSTKIEGYNKNIKKKKDIEEKGISILTHEEIEAYLQSVEKDEDMVLAPQHPDVPKPTGHEYNIKMASIDILLTELFGKRNSQILKRRVIEEYSLEDVGKEFNLSYETVRKIVDNCLETLRLRYPNAGNLIEESHKFISGR